MMAPTCVSDVWSAHVHPPLGAGRGGPVWGIALAFMNCGVTRAKIKKMAKDNFIMMVALGS